MADVVTGDDKTAGTVWWCDGVALAFDPYYKRRPVLVVGEEDAETRVVIPLSSKRYYGQETMVTHSKGVSYMTGRVQTVPVTALVKPLGYWEGFTAWHDAQQGNLEDSRPFLWERFLRWWDNLWCPRKF